jgi:hypothetical protein
LLEQFAVEGGEVQELLGYDRDGLEDDEEGDEDDEAFDFDDPGKKLIQLSSRSK